MREADEGAGGLSCKKSSVRFEPQCKALPGGSREGQLKPFPNNTGGGVRPQEKCHLSLLPRVPLWQPPHIGTGSQLTHPTPGSPHPRRPHAAQWRWASTRIPAAPRRSAVLWLKPLLFSMVCAGPHPRGSWFAQHPVGGSSLSAAPSWGRQLRGLWQWGEGTSRPLWSPGQCPSPTWSCSPCRHRAGLVAGLPPGPVVPGLAPLVLHPPRPGVGKRPRTAMGRHACEHVTSCDNRDFVAVIKITCQRTLNEAEERLSHGRITWQVSLATCPRWTRGAKSHGGARWQGPRWGGMMLRSRWAALETRLLNPIL